MPTHTRVTPPPGATRVEGLAKWPPGAFGTFRHPDVFTSEPAEEGLCQKPVTDSIQMEVTR